MQTEKTSVQELYRPVANISLPDIPTTDTASHEYIFWKEQIRRCIHGWVEPTTLKYINGIQYFNNNFITTDYHHPVKKEPVEDRPLWRDNDNEITSCFWQNLARWLPNNTYQNASSHIEIKARRKGWTYLDLLAGNMYLFVFYPGKYIIGSAYIDDKNITEEREMFRKAWLSLHPIFRRWKGNELEIIADNMTKGEFIVGYKDPKSGEKIAHATWLQKVVDPQSPGIFKGFACRRINVVEAGKWKQKGLLKKFLSQNSDCLRFGSDYIGGYSIGGTSDEIEGVDTDYKLVYFDKKAYPYTRHMTSAVKVHANFFDIHTGITDEQRALEYELSVREEKKDDYIAYQTYVVENPLTEEEMFIPKAQYAYNTALLQNQQQLINYHQLDALWIRGVIEEEMDLAGKGSGIYHFRENPQGEWLVHEKYGIPDTRFQNLYIAGIDDKYKSQAQKTKQSNSSKSAMVIKMRKHNYEFASDRPVAIFLSPSYDLNETFNEFYKGMKFWNIKKSLYEYNHEAFVQFLRNKNALNRLYYVDELPGISPTGRNGILKELTLLGNIFMSEGRYQNIDNSLIINALRKWGGPENTDIGTAWHLLLQLEDYLKDEPVKLVAEESKFQAKFMVLGGGSQADNSFINLGVPDWKRKSAG